MNYLTQRRRERREILGVWGSAPDINLSASSASPRLCVRPSPNPKLQLHMKPLATAFILLCSLSAPALPLPWRADWPDCKPVEKLVHRGTDIELQPTFYVNGQAADTTGWEFTTFVQTNCVGTWFGPFPGAIFSHTNDVGAASYGVMVRAVTASNGVNYTAFARFRMLDSPGFTPGALPLPQAIIDFDEVQVLNPPWPSEGDIAAATNGLDASFSSRLSQASLDSTNYTDRAISIAATNYYTIAETDDAIDSLAAYYITSSNGLPFASYAALTNTTVYYSGGAPRVPTRNDYAVVLADETHGSNEWRYIYATHVVGSITNGQWEAQYPIETNDYEGLSNKPQINSVELTGNVTPAELGLPTFSDAVADVSESGWSFVLVENVSYLTNEAQVVVGGATNTVTTVETNSYPALTLYRNGAKVWTSDPADQGVGWIVALVLAILGAGGGLIWKFIAPFVQSLLPYALAVPADGAAAKTLQLADRTVGVITAAKINPHYGQWEWKNSSGQPIVFSGDVPQPTWDDELEVWTLTTEDEDALYVALVGVPVSAFSGAGVMFDAGETATTLTCYVNIYDDIQVTLKSIDWNNDTCVVTVNNVDINGRVVSSGADPYDYMVIKFPYNGLEYTCEDSMESFQPGSELYAYCYTGIEVSCSISVVQDYTAAFLPPPRADGKPRDFVVNLELETVDGNLAEFDFVPSTGETLSFVTKDGNFPAPQEGKNMYYFTEIEPHVLMVKAETVEEVVGA